MPEKNTKKITEEKEVTPKSEVKKEKDTVEVPRSLLEELLERDKKRDEEIEMLKSAADLSRLNKWEQEHRGELIRKFRVATWRDENGENRIVRMWKSTKDDAWIENGVPKYSQWAKYYLDNGEGNDPLEVELEQLQFVRSKGATIGEVISERVDRFGEYKTLKFDDGREIEFDIRFLNS